MIELDRTAEILALRAQQLARPLESADHEGEMVQLLGFEAGGDRFALPVNSIVTVISNARPTPIPGTPSWLIGAIALRGRVVAVVSPDQFLGTRAAPDVPAGRSTAVVVVSDEVAEVGLFVDQLNPVESISSTAAHPLPAGSSAVVERSARGFVNGRLVLDPGALIAAIRSALDTTTGLAAGDSR